MARPLDMHAAQVLSSAALYTRWKWRVLLLFCGFYTFLYLGRFNFGFVIRQIIDDPGITRTMARFVNACMFWGFGLGDLVHGRLSDRFSARLGGRLGGRAHDHMQLVHQLWPLPAHADDPLRHQQLCQCPVLPPWDPSHCPVVATALAYDYDLAPGHCRRARRHRPHLSRQPAGGHGPVVSSRDDRVLNHR
jgi:hypothetical protein